MSNNFISKGQRNVCVTFVKYYPVLMQVIMLASIFDEFYPFSIMACKKKARQGGEVDKKDKPKMRQGGSVGGKMKRKKTSTKK